MAANLLGYMGTDEPLGGFERTFDKQLAGVDGEATWQSNSGKGVRIPLRESTLKAAHNGAPLRTTIDRDLQWFTQKVLAQSVRQYRAESGAAVVMDTRTGEILALADVPTFDANAPTEADEDDLGSRALSDTYEPGSVEKVLTAASLIDAGKAFPRQRFKVPPSLARQDRVIGDWFDHGNIRLTLAGIIAKSSNIGTVLAADAFSPVELVAYLQRFGLGQRTDVGVRGETPGILTPGEAMTSQTKDRVAFGQSLSVNVAQMAAAVNTVANGGVRVSPSLIAGSAVTDDGVTVGTDVATRTRVVSKQAARATARMMEKVVDPEDGVAPAAQVPGYLVAGKTGTAQRVASDGAGYDGSTSVSFGGFAPADDARFTVYVVVHAPKVDGGGGSIAGPGVLPDHGLRPGPLRRRADRRHAVAPARRVVTRYPRPVHEPESATRPQQSPSTPATELADWLSATTDVAVHGDLAVAVSGISLSTARVRPGDLYAALPGARAHGADFAAQAVAAGAVVVLTDAAGAGPAPAGHARPRGDRAAPRARAPRRADLRRPRRRPARHRRHRHPGQDHHHPRARAGAHRGRRDLGGHRHRRHPDRGRGRQDPAHDAGGAGPARPLRGHARARRRHLRDGGLQPRARARSGRRRRLRRRDLPQPRARPPRLPRRPRRLLRRQGRSLHPRAGPASG